MKEARAFFSGLSAEYDDLYLKDPAYVDALSTLVREVVKAKPARILELGVGTGNLTHMVLLSHRPDYYLGVDNSGEMIETARRKLGPVGGLELREANIQDLVFYEEFDAIITNYTLHHLSHEDKREFCSRAHRWLRKGGVLLYGDVFIRFMRDRTDPERCREIVETFSYRALYYLEHVGFDKMVLEIEHIPYVLRAEREILATAEFWTENLRAAGFSEVSVMPTREDMPCDKVISAQRSRD